MGSDVLTSASGCWLAAGGAAPRPGLRVGPRHTPCVEPPASPLPSSVRGSDLILPFWAVRPCLGVAVSPSPPPLLPSHEVDDVSLVKLCLVGPHPSEWG